MMSTRWIVVVILTVAVAGLLAVAPRQTKIPSGGIPPAWCDTGELWLDTDETVDTNCTTTLDNAICACVALNTWADTKGL